MISIIVPLHNLGSKGNYCLKRCLDSILAQTYNDYEVLLMENGSSDDTVEVAKEYCQKDNRFKLHILDTVGVSNARNKGIELAKGEFISFIDGDDTITDRYFQVAIDLFSESSDISFVQFQIYHFYLNNNKIKPITEYDSTKRIKADKYHYFTMGVNVANKIIRKSIIDKINIRFNTTLDAYEDFLFASEIYFNSIDAYYSNEASYYYTQNRGSQTTKYNIDKLSFSHLLFNEELSNLYKTYNVYDLYGSYIDINFIHFFVGSNFAMTAFRKLNYKNTSLLISNNIDRIRDTNPNNAAALWQKKWFKRFQKSVKYFGAFGGYIFIKFMRLYRNLFIQPLRIKWYK